MRLRAALGLAILAALPVRADRLQTSGFETNNLAQTEWSVTGAPTVSTAQVHSGTYALEIGNGQMYVNRTFSAATTGTFWSRVYVYIKTAMGSSVNYNPIMRHLGAAETCRADFKPSTSKFRVFNNLTSTQVEMSGTLSANTWYRLELRDLLSDTVGECELRIYLGDSTSALETLSITGEDTLSTNLSSIAFGNLIGANWSTGNLYLDDVAINASSGTFQTSWPGPGKIALVKPASEVTITWTKTGANCAGTTNTDCVDDEPGTPDDASGYATSSTANSEDRLNVTSLPAEVVSDADMILFHIYDRWDGNGTTGTRQGRNLLWDESGAQTNGVTHTRCDVAAGNWSLTLPTQSTVFDLGARSKASVNSFDLGYEPLNNAECRITAIWGNVEWIEPPPAAATSFPRRLVQWQ